MSLSRNLSQWRSCSLLYFLNKDWYDVLVNTGFGKGILAVCLLVLLISFAAVIRLTKPVEYKR